MENTTDMTAPSYVEVNITYNMPAQYQGSKETLELWACLEKVVAEGVKSHLRRWGLKGANAYLDLPSYREGYPVGQGIIRLLRVLNQEGQLLIERVDELQRYLESVLPSGSEPRLQLVTE